MTNNHLKIRLLLARRILTLQDSFLVDDPIRLALKAQAFIYGQHGAVVNFIAGYDVRITIPDSELDALVFMVVAIPRRGNSLFTPVNPVKSISQARSPHN